MLTPKREHFCQEMVKPKATQSEAYRVAFTTTGMKAETIHSEASRLMRDPKITARIAELKALAVKRLQLSREQWLKRLEALVQADVRKMFAGPGLLIEIHELGDAEAAMIEGYEVVENIQKVGDQAQLVGYSRKVKLIPKLKALLEFGKAMGWYAKEKPQEASK
jgi:phage terminase small subunit